MKTLNGRRWLSLLIVSGALLVSACRVSVGFHQRWDNGRGNYCYYHRCNTYNAVAEEQNAQDESAQNLAANYAIRLDSAQKIMTIANMDTADMGQYLKSNGIDANALAPLAKYELPSKDAIQQVANFLNEDSSKVEHMMTDYIHDMK